MHCECEVGGLVRSSGEDIRLQVTGEAKRDMLQETSQLSYASVD